MECFEYGPSFAALASDLNLSPGGTVKGLKNNFHFGTFPVREMAGNAKFEGRA
jgi:hypothetical protein